MQGRFLSGIELVRAPDGAALVLRRKPFARWLPLLLAGAGLGAASVEVLGGRALLAALLVLLSLTVLVLALRAELDLWSLDGGQSVRRTFSLGALSWREVRLSADDIRRVGCEEAGARSRAWLETKGGEQHALVQGDARSVREIAEAWAASVQFAATTPASHVVH